jgi:hypothetical protein
MKNYLFFLFFFFSISCFSQEPKSNDEWIYGTLYNGERVFINKKVTAFTIYTSRTINGNETSELNNPDLNNPFDIYITSDENKASIRVNNKYYKEDLYLEFTKIYKINSNKEFDEYVFIDGACYVSYYIPKKGNIDHQSLNITCVTDENNKSFISFTISKYHQM